MNFSENDFHFSFACKLCAVEPCVPSIGADFVNYSSFWYST